jgi:protein TonB
MNTNILVSGTLALAIHAFLFVLPLSKVMSGTRAPTDKPISLSIINPQETVAAVPQVEVSAEVREQPRLEARSQRSERQTVISKKEVAARKSLAADSMTAEQIRPEEIRTLEPVADRGDENNEVEESPLDYMQEDQGKNINSSLPVRAATITSDGERAVGTPHEGRSGDEVIVDARPKYKENPLPHYPKVARRRGYEGRTVLRVEVLESGKVGRIEIADSSGFEVLDKAALGSVKGWTFLPGTRNGKKTTQWVMVPVRFSLR